MVANLGIFSESCKYFSKKLQILDVFPNMSSFLYLCNAKLRLISIEMISLTINNNEIANTIRDGLRTDEYNGCSGSASVEDSCGNW